MCGAPLHVRTITANKRQMAAVFSHAADYLDRSGGTRRVATRGVIQWAVERKLGYYVDVGAVQQTFCEFVAVRSCDEWDRTPGRLKAHTVEALRQLVEKLRADL